MRLTPTKGHILRIPCEPIGSSQHEATLEPGSAVPAKRDDTPNDYESSEQC